MKGEMSRTKRGAASIYIVIFTTTLLGIIALSFVRIMLAEALRTTNYNLSQSAYNSALAGIEDAKIALLRYQNCLNDPGFLNDCYKYTQAFETQQASETTAQNCDIVRDLLGYIGEEETIIQTDNSKSGGTNTKKGSAEAFDQAYTCVKVTSHTNDYIATLNNSNPTKLIPIRASTDSEQNSIDRIELEWFSLEDYRKVAGGDGHLGEKWFDSTTLTGKLTSNNVIYEKGNDHYANNFINANDSKSGMAPPVIQATYMQTNNTFTLDEFYARNGANTNRGTLMLRPSSANEAATIVSSTALAYSANKSFNTPIDIKCSNLLEAAQPANYSCRSSINIPSPYRGINAGRNRSTSFLLLNLPYSVPSTEVRVKMYTCQDNSLATDAEIEKDGKTSINCSTIKFAGVQPIVDSTGRANDLFRRVEARIELVDTYFPLSNYALAMTDDTNNEGISKTFYVTNNCRYSSSKWDNNKKDVVNVQNNPFTYETGTSTKESFATSCADVSNTASGNGKGNGEKSN